MNLARRFNAGDHGPRGSRRVATIESAFQASLRDAAHVVDSSPALKDRAKLIPTLRVEVLRVS